MAESSKAGERLREAKRLMDEAEGGGRPTLDLSGLGLGPLFLSGWEGWEALGLLDQLTTLVLYENEITAIPVDGWRAIRKLGNLERLALSGNQISVIPAEGWYALANLEALYLSVNQISEIPLDGWRALRQFTHLSFTRVNA